MIIKFKLKEFSPHYFGKELQNYIWTDKEIEISDAELIKIFGKITSLEICMKNPLVSEQGMNYIKAVLKNQE